MRFVTHGHIWLSFLTPMSAFLPQQTSSSTRRLPPISGANAVRPGCTPPLTAPTCRPVGSTARAAATMGATPRLVHNSLPHRVAHFRSASALMSSDVVVRRGHGDSDPDGHSAADRRMGLGRRLVRLGAVSHARIVRRTLRSDRLDLDACRDNTGIDPWGEASAKRGAADWEPGASACREGATFACAAPAAQMTARTAKHSFGYRSPRSTGRRVVGIRICRRWCARSATHYDREPGHAPRRTRQSR